MTDEQIAYMMGMLASVVLIFMRGSFAAILVFWILGLKSPEEGELKKIARDCWGIALGINLISCAIGAMMIAWKVWE